MDLEEPPAGGASQTDEPIGAKINDIFIYISICMCMYVYVSSSVRFGSFQVSFKLRSKIRFKV